MNTRIPGTVRTTDLDGEKDTPITPIPPRQILTNENGEQITDENDEPIYI